MMTHELLDMARFVTRNVMAQPPEKWGGNVGMGADGTPTSYIDRVAEDAVLEFMEQNDVQANLLSEEAGFIDRGFDEVLVIDPVDGTYNAIRGLPFFSISIARGGKTLADVSEGLVFNMVSGDYHHAEKGMGAFLNGQPIHTRKPESDMVLMAYMGSSASPRTYELAARFRRVRALGAASLDLCAVASGMADAYYLEYIPAERSLRIMDIAAGVLILREAGGEAYCPNGKNNTQNNEILDMPLSLDVRKNIMAVGSNSVLEAMEA
jgi:fructose-1,6-bisphosphatase/inositol monophosphatase family enzyme